MVFLRFVLLGNLCLNVADWLLNRMRLSTATGCGPWALLSGYVFSCE